MEKIKKMNTEFRRESLVESDTQKVKKEMEW
jgi:hypothetical protein